MVDIVNSGIQNVANGVNSFIGLLAWSPFNSVKEALIRYAESSELFRFINWVVPIAEMVALLEGWGVCIGIWYGLSILLRWLKAVQ